jgi:LruC domain-containing protein
VEELDEVELPADSYIGYEDRPRSGDFDYNDFGMRATITETYLDDELQTIDMEFTSRVHLAGDSHDIHIERTLDSGVEWDLTLDRPNHTASGNEKVEVTDESGSGTLDVVLFDTDNFAQDNTVTLSVDITSGSVSPPTNSPRPDVEANNALFEVYDPYMNNRSQGTTIDLGTIQDDVVQSEIGGGAVEGTWTESDVPNIIVVPDTNFVPPEESETITGAYPEFDDYYGSDDTEDTLSLDTNFDDWYTNPA